MFVYKSEPYKKDPQMLQKYKSTKSSIKVLILLVKEKEFCYEVLRKTVPTDTTFNLC